MSLFLFCRYVHIVSYFRSHIYGICLSLSDLPSLGMSISRCIHIAAKGGISLFFRRLFQLFEKLPIFFPRWPCHWTLFPATWEHSGCSNSLTNPCCQACFTVQDCCFLLSCHFISFFLIGWWLLYNVVLAPVTQQHELALSVHNSSPPWPSFPSLTPCHPSRLLQSSRLSSLCHKATAHYLFYTW